MESVAKQVAEEGLFLALALVASYIETLLPLSFAVPGIKLGLANAVVMVLLYQRGKKSAILVSILRILLAAVMFQGVFTIIYSLAGAFFSLAVMLYFKKRNYFGVVGVSVLGGVCHNLGQLLTAVVIVENKAVFYYFPVLLIAGVVSGCIIGILTGEIIKRFKIC